MAKQAAATLLILGTLLLGGCSTTERPPRADRATDVGPRECTTGPQDETPPGTTTPQPVPTADDHTTTPAADETAEPEMDGEPPAQSRGPSRTEPNEPIAAEATEPNDVQSREPNEVTAVEPDGAGAVPAEPNDTMPREPGQEAPIALFYPEYAQVLQTYVLENGLVDYTTLNRRRLDLKAILADLDELDPNVYEGWSQEEKLAFWINAYNLKMLDIITRNYPIESSWWLRLTWSPSDIRHIKGIWTDYKFIVMDEEFTLAEVERRFFQAFDDPRAYLAITYASRSSPSLRRTPYRGESLDRQLDQQVREFLAAPQGVQIDRRDMVVRLSALFKPTWRGKEFVRRYGTDKKFKDRDPQTQAVLNFLTGYLSAEDVYFLEVENYRIEYMNFDWRLNGTSKGY